MRNQYVYIIADEEKSVRRKLDKFESLFDSDEDEEEQQGQEGEGDNEKPEVDDDSVKEEKAKSEKKTRSAVRAVLKEKTAEGTVVDAAEIAAK